MNIYVKRLKAVARVLAGDVSLELAFRVAILAVFVGVIFYYVIGRKQSFTVYASTNSVAVTITGDDALDWELSGASLCLRKADEGDASAESLAPEPRCSPRLFVNGVSSQPKNEEGAQSANATENSEPQISEVSWVAGTRLVIDQTDDGLMTIVITYDPEPSRQFSTFDGIPITANSILFFPRSSLAKTEAVFVKGRVQIGNPVEARTTFLLLKGSYEIRERLGLSSGPTLTAKGTLLPGDSVTVVDRHGADVPAQMVLMPPARASDRGFDIVATTPLRRSALQVERIGAAQTRITTRWMDRLASDALPLALSILLGLLGASLGIAKSLVAPVPTKDTPKQPPADKEPS